MKHGEKLCVLKYYRLSKKYLQYFRYRVDPVPFILKWSGGRSGNPKHCNEMRQTAAHEQISTIKIRAKRSSNRLDQFYHWDSGHYRTWKNKKIKKQWMKNK